MVILTYMNKNNIHTLGNRETSNLLNKYRNIILHDSYECYVYYSEYNKFKDYYIIYYYRNIKLCKIIYYNSENYHRLDGPALIEYHKNGEICKKEYYINGKRYSYEDYVLEVTKLV